jgi:two-component system OmpR family sensor kinase
VQAGLVGLLAPLALLLLATGVAVRLVVPWLMASIETARIEIAARGAGNLAPISDEGMPRELTPMVESVNRLLARLHAVLAAERAFAANSAHELRTPVAAALAQAEVLACDLTGPALPRAQSLVAVLSRLARMVEKLLQLSRVEAGAGLAREPVDLNRLAAAVFDSYARQSRYHGRIRLRPCPSPTIVGADLDALGIALGNLVDNAFAHGGPDVHVDIMVGADGTICVSDDGMGVEPEGIGRLHEPFVRAGTAAAGSGLGLSIAATIATHAGGELRLESNGRFQGFTATLRLPTSAATPA